VKTAVELLDALVAQIRPPRGVTVSIAERLSRGPADPNWIAGIGSVPLTVSDRFAKCIGAWRASDPIIDWSNVPTAEGRKRRVGINLPDDDAFEAGET
jgi:hypothetical protein